MVILKVTNSLNSDVLKVGDVKLDQHTPVDVIKMIVERDGRQKPPPGSIWIMKRAVVRPGDREIDQYATFSANVIDENIDYVLIAVK